MAHRRWTLFGYGADSIESATREHNALYDAWKVERSRATDMLDENNRLDRDLDEARKRIVELESPPVINKVTGLPTGEHATPRMLSDETIDIMAREASYSIGCWGYDNWDKGIMRDAWRNSVRRSLAAIDVVPIEKQEAPTRVPFSDAQIERMARAAKRAHKECFYSDSNLVDIHTDEKWRRCVCAALAAGGLEPCAVPEYDPEEVALAPTGHVLRDRLVEAEAKIERQRAELGRLNTERDNYKSMLEEEVACGSEYLERAEALGCPKDGNINDAYAWALDRIAALRERASVPVPAGVPSVEELDRISAKAFTKEATAEGTPRSCRLASVTAIRDAVLAGVAGEDPCLYPTEEFIAAILNDEVDRENDGFLTDLSIAIQRRSYFAPEYRTNMIAEIAASQRMYSDLVKALTDKPSVSTFTPPADQVEALARVLREACADHCKYDAVGLDLPVFIAEARAAIAHLSKRPGGLPTAEELDRISEAAFDANDGTKFAATRAILTALRPWLRDPVGFELDVTVEEIYTAWYKANDRSHEGRWQAVLDLCRSRISPVYECKECEQWRKDWDSQSKAYEILSKSNSKACKQINTIRAALEGE